MEKKQYQVEVKIHDEETDKYKWKPLLISSMLKKVYVFKSEEHAQAMAEHQLQRAEVVDVRICPYLS